MAPICNGQIFDQFCVIATFPKEKQNYITAEGRNGHHHNSHITADTATGTNSTPIIQTRASTYDRSHIRMKVPKMNHA
jgi:hypothetical protein